MADTKDKEVIVGIDLGTTNSLISVVDSGFPIVLADDEGRRIMPSVVSFLPGGKVAVGDEAARGKVIHSGTTVSSIKRVIGRRFSDLSEEEVEALPFSIKSGDNDELLIDLGSEGTRSPEEISAAILGKLKAVAESALESSVDRAVITVPAYFSHSQREATKAAAELAGWQVERILNEPTAAALAYGLNQSEDVQTVAVYDFGGGTFDLSILELRDGVFEVIATAGDTHLGGDDIDNAVSDWLIREIGLKAEEISREQQATLLGAARKAKEALSEQEATTIDLPFFDGAASFSAELTREKLESLAAPFLEKTRIISQRAILEAKHKGTEEIDHLILVGGSTRMPLVRSRLEEWIGLKPNLTQHPDEAIAIGAGIQAGIMCGRVRQVILLDVVPLSLGIETIGGLMNVIIPRNTTIPTKAGELFTNGVSNQESMAVRVLQGERELAKDNWLLGEVAVPFEPGPKGSARVGVQFEIDESGILTVLTRDTKTGKDQILKIESSAVDVNDDAVEQMVSESVEHAFDDMNNRILTETRMKSEELLPAVDSALQLVGDHISEEEKAGIEASAARVRELIAMENPPLSDLKAANADLDAGTQNLAAILVEMAMEQAFSEE